MSQLIMQFRNITNEIYKLRMIFHMSHRFVYDFNKFINVKPIICEFCVRLTTFLIRALKQINLKTFFESRKQKKQIVFFYLIFLFEFVQVLPCEILYTSQSCQIKVAIFVFTIISATRQLKFLLMEKDCFTHTSNTTAQSGKNNKCVSPAP